MGAVQTTEDDRPSLACLSPRPFTNEAMADFMARHTVLPLTLVSDGLKCFKGAATVGAIHDREITGGGKASVINDRFMALNTLIGNIKTALTGTYRAIKFAKYAYRYLSEVQFRFTRLYDLRAIRFGLLTALLQDPRRPERGIRVAELHRKSGAGKICQTDELAALMNRTRGRAGSRPPKSASSVTADANLSHVPATD